MKYIKKYNESIVKLPESDELYTILNRKEYNDFKSRYALLDVTNKDLVLVKDIFNPSIIEFACLVGDTFLDRKPKFFYLELDNFINKSSRNLNIDLLKHDDDWWCLTYNNGHSYYLCDGVDGLKDANPYLH